MSKRNKRHPRGGNGPVVVRNDWGGFGAADYVKHWYVCAQEITQWVKSTEPAIYREFADAILRNALCEAMGRPMEFSPEDIQAIIARHSLEDQTSVFRQSLQ